MSRRTILEILFLHIIFLSFFCRIMFTTSNTEKSAYVWKKKNQCLKNELMSLWWTRPQTTIFIFLLSPAMDCCFCKKQQLFFPLFLLLLDSFNWRRPSFVELLIFFFFHRNYDVNTTTIRCDIRSGNGVKYCDTSGNNHLIAIHFVCLSLSLLPFQGHTKRQNLLSKVVVSECTAKDKGHNRLHAQ